jgi:ribonuclease HII
MGALRGMLKAYARYMARPIPTLAFEHELIASGHLVVAGMDEVGRGALAGPVTIGVVAVDATVTDVPAGLADSKLMTPKRRDAMVPVVKQWGIAWATGSATAQEIDKFGVMTAMGLAGSRALGALGIVPDIVILDGNSSFLMEEDNGPRILTRVKADQDCACVSAASVIAKVERDALMTLMHEQYPHYGWDGNKGYGAAVHTAAIQTYGVTDLHRRSWNLGV